MAQPEARATHRPAQRGARSAAKGCAGARVGACQATVRTFVPVAAWRSMSNSYWSDDRKVGPLFLTYPVYILLIRRRYFFLICRYNMPLFF